MAETQRYSKSAAPPRRNTITLAVKDAQTAAAAFAHTMRSFIGREVCFSASSKRSISTPGRIYPTADSIPILPTMPKLRAITLCTAPIIAAQPFSLIITAATTRNIREKLVPTPPGI